ncbi:MAG: protein-methionine-sulfoxide reductase catalytic subunit MsrP, partial [Thermaurantiacus sp.]
MGSAKEFAMHVRRRPDWATPEREVTPEHLYFDRRALIAAGGAAMLAAPAGASTDVNALAALRARRTRNLDEGLTPLAAVAGYNNFYEFGLDKGDPARNAHTLRPTPWTLAVGGLVAKPLRLDVDTLIARLPLEERIYRMRCVEGWSMVIPWLGVPLSAVLSQAEPLGSARFVRFTTLADSGQMPGLGNRVIDWPYREGLRLDEAMHPLTMLTVGLYGRRLPNQNGAPVRLVVPWKYGFKSAKSIVRIDLVERQPLTSWVQSAPR